MSPTKNKLFFVFTDIITVLFVSFIHLGKKDRQPTLKPLLSHFSII